MQSQDQAPIIRLRGITREFVSGNGETTRVLDNVDLDIQPGTFNVISGESGSGKTTLLRILGMLDSGYEGGYEFAGEPVHGRPDWYLDEMRANNLGFIFQEGRLFGHMTLRRNIEIPLELHRHSARGELDEVVGALEPEFFSERERAKNTVSLKPGAASGGQGQRASIMRAIVNRPALILADEPTASLHGDLKNDVVEHLKSLAEQGHTVIVVSHDAVFFDAGRQLRLENGVMHELAPGGGASGAPIPPRLPDDAQSILRGWRPRATLQILLRQAVHETLFRPLFLFLILSAIIVGVTQLSVFSSVILGARIYVNEKITEGSRLNRIEVAPRSRDRAEEDKFPVRDEIAAFDQVTDVVVRRQTTARLMLKSGKKLPFSVSGLHPDDPEYGLLRFLGGGGFSGAHDQPEIILTAAIMPDIFDTSALEGGTGSYDDFIGQSVQVIVNRINIAGDPVAEVPVEMKLVGVIANGEGGRQLYLPNTTLVFFDALLKDRRLEYRLPEGAGVNNWPDAETIAARIKPGWENALQVYIGDIQQVMVNYARLSKLGYRPQSEIWDFKWALDIQDTAWRIFLPMLVLIVIAVFITVFANITISARLRATELALWRVLGMRRGDLVLTQVASIAFSVTSGTLLGLGIGSLIIMQTKAMLLQRSLQNAEALGEEVQNFDAIFAPVGQFFWPLMAASVAVGIVAALWPAIRTAQTDPAKVLNS